MAEISGEGRPADAGPIFAHGPVGTPSIATSVEAVAESLLVSALGNPPLETAEIGHSIRIPKRPRQALCPHCKGFLRVAGPTGYEDGRPICDICMLERSQDLGMLLLLASAIRAFASYRSVEGERYRQALGELGVVARIYERLAARSGPPRPFRIPGRMGEPEEVAEEGGTDS